jgi:hypothetical protein
MKMCWLFWMMSLTLSKQVLFKCIWLIESVVIYYVHNQNEIIQRVCGKAIKRGPVDTTIILHVVRS